MTFELNKAKGLYFDIYATLIDWEAGIYPSLLVLSQRLPKSNPLSIDSPETRQTLLRMYATIEKEIEHANPKLAYPKILEQVYARIATQLGDINFEPAEAVAFGQSIGDWPAFPDTVAAMQILSKYYKLFVLSNVDNASFARTCAGPLNGVHWDGIYTAETIGSYKPNPNNYNFVVARAQEDFGISKDQLLMVAQNLNADHASNTALKFKPGVWIARGGSAMGGNRSELEEKGSVKLGATYATLGDMAEAVEKAFA